MVSLCPWQRGMAKTDKGASWEGSKLRPHSPLEGLAGREEQRGDVHLLHRRRLRRYHQPGSLSAFKSSQPCIQIHPEFHTITLIHEPEKPVVGPQAIAQAGNSQCAQLGSQASEATSQVPQVSQSPGQR